MLPSSVQLGFAPSCVHVGGPQSIHSCWSMNNGLGVEVNCIFTHRLKNLSIEALMVARYASSSGCNLAARAWELTTNSRPKAMTVDDISFQVCASSRISMALLHCLSSSRDKIASRYVAISWAEWQLQVVPKWSNVTFWLQKLEPRHCLQTGGLVEVKKHDTRHPIGWSDWNS